LTKHIYLYISFIYHKIPIITLHLTHINLQLAILGDFVLRD